MSIRIKSQLHVLATIFQNCSTRASWVRSTVDRRSLNGHSLWVFHSTTLILGINQQKVHGNQFKCLFGSKVKYTSTLLYFKIAQQELVVRGARLTEGVWTGTTYEFFTLQLWFLELINKRFMVTNFLFGSEVNYTSSLLCFKIAQQELVVWGARLTEGVWTGTTYEFFTLQFWFSQ